MRNRFIKSMAVVMALSFSAITFSQTAEAGKRGRAFGLGLGLGVAGLAIGSALAHSSRGYYGGRAYYNDDYYYGSRSRYRRRYNRPYYRTHSRTYYYADEYVPRRRAHRGRPRPWSSAWYRYCANKYRSFNASNGTFQPYKGGRRLCR